jgi:hypothetical protein
MDLPSAERGSGVRRQSGHQKNVQLLNLKMNVECS